LLRVGPMQKPKSSPDSAGNDANKRVESLISVPKEHRRNKVAGHDANNVLTGQ
jgi:hypothetical protein